MILTLLLGLMALTGCNAGGDAAGGGSGFSALSASAPVDDTFHTYTFEVTGNGITMTTLLNGFDALNYAGVQSTTINDPMRVYGVATQTFTVVAKSVSGSFTYKAGPGLIAIVTKKDGVVVRSDTLIIVNAVALVTIPN